MKYSPESDGSQRVEYLHSYSVDLDSREIYLYREIDEETAVSFIKNINLLNNISADPIIIWCSCPGGDMSSSFGIYDAIKLSASPTILVSCGQVSSMGTIIAQAATLRLVLPSTVFLIHEGYISLDESEAKTAIANVQSMRLYVGRLYDIYFSSCKNGPFFAGKTEKFVRSFLKKNIQKKSDWFIVTEEIVKYGLANGILGSEKYKNLDEVVKMVYPQIEDDSQLKT